MALYGQLSTMSLMDLLQWAGLNRKNGVFELERNKISKKLLFNDGKVVACYSNDPQSRLGQFLLSRGKVDREQLQDALRRQQATGESLGAILLDLKLITEGELTSLMSQKAEEMILSLFDWREAIFRFEEQGSLGPYVIEVDLTVDNILLKGLQRVDELSIIRRVFPDSGLVLGLTGKTVPQEVENSSMASRIVKAIDGERTIAEVMLHTNSSDFLVLKFLYNLFNRGVLQIMGRRETGETVTIVDPWRKKADDPADCVSIDMLDGPLALQSKSAPPSAKTNAADGIDDALQGLTASSEFEPGGSPQGLRHAVIDEAPRFEIEDPFATAASDESAAPFGEDSPFVIADPATQEANASLDLATNSQVETTSDSEASDKTDDNPHVERNADPAANIFAAHDSLQDAADRETPADQRRDSTDALDSAAPSYGETFELDPGDDAPLELASPAESTRASDGRLPHAESESELYESEPAPSETDFKFELDTALLREPAGDDDGFGDLGSEFADSKADLSSAKLDTAAPSEDQAAEAVRQLAIEMEQTLTIVPWSEKQRDPASAQEQAAENGRLVDLRSGLETAKQLMSRSEYNEALDVLNRCYVDHPDDAHLKDMIAKAESGYMSKAADRGLGGGAVPKRTQRSLGQDEAQLPPQSSYLFSMIDGVTEVRALYWLAPMREVEVLRILDRLRGMGLVELTQPEEGSSEPSLAPQSISDSCDPGDS